MLHWDKSIRDSKKVEENVIYVNARYVYNLCPDVTQIFFNYYGRIHFNYKANYMHLQNVQKSACVSVSFYICVIYVSFFF